MHERDDVLRGPSMSRRSALRLAGGAALAGGLAGTVLLGGPASAHGTLIGRDAIWYEPIYRDGTSTRTTFEFEPTFYSQLEGWLLEYYATTPSWWLKPIYLWCAGTHVDKNIAGTNTPSYHSYARAMDITKVTMHSSATGARFDTFNGNYAQWRSWPSSTLTGTRRYYWAFVAGLSKRFCNVLHYLSDSNHHDHVHVDNQYYGNGASLSTSRSSQVYTVQACLKYIWGYTSVTLDGDFGPQTSSYAAQALTRMGLSGAITTTSNFQQFLLGSVRMGTGSRSY